MYPLDSGIAVHVLAHHERLTAADVRDLCDLLAPDECDRRDSFRFEHDAAAYVLAHAHLRRVLSQYERVPPGAWRFGAGRFGKPELDGPIATTLRFNLSHTAGCIVCAVTRGREVGVDVERLDPLPELLELARVVFAPSEVEKLALLDDPARTRRFYELWTRKEAYLKARGVGLSGIGRPDLEAEDDLPSWRFDALSPTREHVIALAVRDRDVAVWPPQLVAHRESRAAQAL